MPEPVYLIYTYQGQAFTEYHRRGGMGVPSYLAYGPESAFVTMCYMAEDGLKSDKKPMNNADPLDYNPLGTNPPDYNPFGRKYNDPSAYYGGFLVNFDLRVILLACEDMYTMQKLDADHPFGSFYWYPKHRTAMSRVIEEFWINWRVMWVKEKEFLQYSTAGIELDQISTEDDVLPQNSHWQDKCLHISQQEIENFYRKEFDIIRQGHKVNLEPFVIDAVWQEIFDAHAAAIAERLRQI
ncbi:hypothetical protein [Deinococcus aquatilis]|uniref:hypothetical protein n=1 Tax=Deinococcus aquatilis TaxID=519440 RepID=UPI0012F933EB|nr:hypothetical protein [Deinococcus aquatilis]